MDDHFRVNGNPLNDFSTFLNDFTDEDKEMATKSLKFSLNEITTSSTN